MKVNADWHQNKFCVFLISVGFITPEEKRPLQTPGCRREGTIKIYHKEISPWPDGVNCIQLLKIGVQLPVLVNLGLQEETGDFFDQLSNC